MVEGTGKVFGEIITIKPKYLNISIKLLDKLEDYYGLNNDNNLYHCILGHCKASDGSLVECYMYLYSTKKGGLKELINEGDFKKYYVSSGLISLKKVKPINNDRFKKNMREVTNMNSKEKLMKIKNEGIFTAGQPFDQFVSELCKRYSRIYGEILPIKDYDYIVMKLEEKGILDDEDEDDKSLV